MKPTLKKNTSQSATKYTSTRPLSLEVEEKESPLNSLTKQKNGKSRQEIFDLMKILKTF